MDDYVKMAICNWGTCGANKKSMKVWLFCSIPNLFKFPEEVQHLIYTPNTIKVDPEVAEMKPTLLTNGHQFMFA